MIKSRIIKLKSIENGEIIVAMTMPKIIIITTTVIIKITIIIMMKTRIKTIDGIKI